MSIFHAIEDEGEKISQGDIFIDIYSASLNERVNAVVITPECDLIHDKADYIKFVATVPFRPIIRQLLINNAGIDEDYFESGKVISKTKYHDAIDKLMSNINGDIYPRYYLIPRYSEELPECYLDFQRIFAIIKSQVYENFMNNRFASIESPWIEQIITRYNGYSVRVGTPDFDEQDQRLLLSEAGLTLPPIKDS